MNRFCKTVTQAEEIKRKLYQHTDNNSCLTPEQIAIGDLCDLVDALIRALPDNVGVGATGQRHGYWTGALMEDFVPKDEEEERGSFQCTPTSHITHCSVCGAIFDDRTIDGWIGCPKCLSVLDLERPFNAYYLGKEDYL